MSLPGLVLKAEREEELESKWTRTAVAGKITKFTALEQPISKLIIIWESKHSLKIRLPRQCL